MNHSAVWKIKLFAVGGLSAFALAACGGDDTEEEGPDDVTKQYLLAVADQDGEAACGYFSSTAIEQIEADEGASCEDSVQAVSAGTSDEDRQQLEDATYEVTDESEDGASVTVSRPDGDEETFELVQEGDAWKIAG